MMSMCRVLRAVGLRSRKAKIFMATVAAISWGLLAGAPVFAQTPGVTTNPGNFHQPLPQINSAKQTEQRKQALRDYKFQQMKKHAERLSELATSLQKEIDDSNENVLSLKIARKAAQIEKLAKQIKNEAKGD